MPAPGAATPRNNPWPIWTWGDATRVSVGDPTAGATARQRPAIAPHVRVRRVRTRLLARVEFTDCTPRARRRCAAAGSNRSEEHTSELQSLMRISYDVFCLTKKK